MGDGDGRGGVGDPFRYAPDPAGCARAESLLRSWHAIETLTPRTYVRESELAAGGEIVRLSGRRLPWQANRPPRKNHVVYFQVFLGAIEMGPATRLLVSALGDGDGADARGEPPPAPRQSMAAIAAVLVDRDGVPVEGGLSVSSFAWALPSALGGNLARIGRWAEAESRVKERLSSLLRRTLLDGRSAPLAMSDLTAAHDWIVDTLGLPGGIVRPPAFASRIMVSDKSKSDPGPAILNSYLLADLERARDHVARDRLSAAARAYLGMDAPVAPVDLLADRGALAALLSPKLIPPARWPAPGGAPLVTLQQAAANGAGSLLAGGTGILAVNGPPGTGKTTLLRDVVASCVLRRAEAMCAFERPDDAFEAVEGDFEARGRRVTPYRVHASLKGHEVLVASSNNRAVENISRELPALRAVDPSFSGLRHFRSLSDAVARSAADPDRKGRPLPESDRTWGLAAAVFGRSANRRDFVETFWWDADSGMRTWLSLAAGESVSIRIRDDDGKVIGKRPPSLLDGEDLPRGPRQAADRWLAARAAFQERRARIASLLDAASAIERAGAGGPGDLAAALAECDRLRDAGMASADAVRVAREALASAEAGEVAARKLAALAPVVEGGAAASGMRYLAVRARSAEEASAGCRSALEAAEASRSTLATLYREGQALVRSLRLGALNGGRPVDDDYFAGGHESWNAAVPWIDDAVQAERDALFADAMRVHEAFVLAAADRVRANLNGFVGATGTHAPGLEGCVGDFWTTMFLAVPVLSTTFASVERMLTGLPDEGLGWLVVDEAGQAAPQAAVGAMMRVRRAVVVGDPLQVEPVITLPDAVTRRICSEFGVDAAGATAPSASVQTLADRASPLRGSFRDAAGGRRETGLPLLVHRRCQEPMFSISNRVAYDGQMVHAVPDRGEPGPVESALGASRWINVPFAASEGRWRPSEGEALLDLLATLLADRGPAPDMFVISPYREVADLTRALVRRQRRLFSPSRLSSEAWAAERVGTIHAFQGREAEAVVLILGASGEASFGSRRWAARTPNILNVAVSRAKRVLYVIGDRGDWARAGCFRELADALPVEARSAAVAA